MNIQHSSRTDQWGTPADIIERARVVLGGIDLDPASDYEWNQTVRAKAFITEKEDALSMPWTGGVRDGEVVPVSVFLNPPGGKKRNKSLAGLFWRDLMTNVALGNITHAIFVAFSAEALQNTQGKECRSIGDFLICVPSKRIRFVSSDGSPGAAPSHSNVVVVYVPGTIENSREFIEQFRPVGSILQGV